MTDTLGCQVVHYILLIYLWHTVLRITRVHLVGSCITIPNACYKWVFMLSTFRSKPPFKYRWCKVPGNYRQLWQYVSNTATFGHGSDTIACCVLYYLIYNCKTWRNSDNISSMLDRRMALGLGLHLFSTPLSIPSIPKRG